MTQPAVSPVKISTGQQILEAAEAIVAETGFEALSAKSVADRAGVNKALVFYHWKSTTALFEKVLQRYYERHKAELAGAVEGGGSIDEQLHRVVDTLVDSMTRTPAYPRLVQHQIASQGEHIGLVHRHLGDVLRWTEAILEGLTPKSGPLAARHFHLSLSAAVINSFTYGPAFGIDMSVCPEERRAHLHWLVDTLLAGLREG